MKDVAMLRMMASSSAFAKVKAVNKMKVGGGGGGGERNGAGGRPDDDKGTDSRSIAEERNDNVVQTETFQP